MTKFLSIITHKNIFKLSRDGVGTVSYEFRFQTVDIICQQTDIRGFLSLYDCRKMCKNAKTKTDREAWACFCRRSNI